MNSYNTYIKTSYSQGTASITYSFYKTNLCLRFTPWNGQLGGNPNTYDKAKAISTTISDESAAALYFLSNKIIAGKVKNPVLLEIPCNGDAMIRFEYYPERAVLTIEKQGQRVMFDFTSHRYMEKENGRTVTKNIWSGLIVFAEVLETYLSSVAADRQTGTMSEDNYDDPYPSTGW